jgi:hypothetical protein
LNEQNQTASRHRVSRRSSPTYLSTEGTNEQRDGNKIVFIIEDLEAKSQEPFNRFFDTLGHDEVELNFKYVIHISLHRRLTYADRPPIKSAILATDSTIVHYAKLHAVLTQGSPINVRVFQDREETAKWLGVPIERLVLAPQQRSANQEKQL